MTMAPSDPDWAGLPEHLLDLISDKFDLLSDYVRFSAVCPSWRSTGIHNKKKRWDNISTCNSNSNPPLLMTPTKDSNKYKRNLYSITDAKSYKFKLPVSFNMRCCGSSHGWLVFFNKIVEPILYNPFIRSRTNNTIRLPQIKTRYFGDETLVKVVLSANPSLSPNNYVVAALYSVYQRLAFLKAGDKSWTYVDQDFRPCYDVIFYKHRILALNVFGGIISVDIVNNNNQVKIISPSGPRLFSHGYLVESSSSSSTGGGDGDLLMVARIFYDVSGMSESEEEKYIYVTKTFEVYKLVLDDLTGMVVDKIAVKSLGDEALFLGDNYSMSILVASNKYGGYLKPNSIYFTDDFSELELMPCGPRDTGVFNLEDGSFDKHYILDPSQNNMPRPIWIVPTLQGFGIGM